MPAPKKRKQYIRKPAKSPVVSVPVIELSARNGSDVTGNISSEVQSVLDGKVELINLELDELESYLTAKENVSPEDIEQLRRRITESYDEVDECYFMREVLNSFSTQLDESNTMRNEIIGLINLLNDYLHNLESESCGKCKPLSFHQNPLYSFVLQRHLSFT